MITTRTIADQVTESLAGFTDDFDISAIVSDIVTLFGVVDIDDIPSDAYAEILAKHDISL